MGKGGEIQLTDGLKALLARRPIFAYEYAGRRHDVGTSSATCGRRGLGPAPGRSGRRLPGDFGGGRGHPPRGTRPRGSRLRGAARTARDQSRSGPRRRPPPAAAAVEAPASLPSHRRRRRRARSGRRGPGSDRARGGAVGPRPLRDDALSPGWLDEDLAPARAPTGKRLRPVLCLLAAEACGDDFGKAMPAAVALDCCTTSP